MTRDTHVTDTLTGEYLSRASQAMTHRKAFFFFSISLSQHITSYHQQKHGFRSVPDVVVSSGQPVGRKTQQFRVCSTRKPTTRSLPTSVAATASKRRSFCRRPLHTTQNQNLATSNYYTQHTFQHEAFLCHRPRLCRLRCRLHCPSDQVDHDDSSHVVGRA